LDEKQSFPLLLFGSGRKMTIKDHLGHIYDISLWTKVADHSTSKMSSFSCFIFFPTRKCFARIGISNFKQIFYMAWLCHLNH